MEQCRVQVSLRATRGRGKALGAAAAQGGICGARGTALPPVCAIAWPWAWWLGSRSRGCPAPSPSRAQARARVGFLRAAKSHEATGQIPGSEEAAAGRR